MINFSLGKGDWLVRECHQYGGKVIATVVSEKHAKSAEAMGADALMVTGHEAAAHGGDVTSLVLVPAIAGKVNIPLVRAPSSSSCCCCLCLDTSPCPGPRRTLPMDSPPPCCPSPP